MDMEQVHRIYSLSDEELQVWVDMTIYKLKDSDEKGETICLSSSKVQSSESESSQELRS